MIEALEMMSTGIVDPSVMITHIGGLDCVPDTTLHLPEIPGGKKLIYTNISMSLTAISDFREKGEKDAFFKNLDIITRKNNGLWSIEAEKFLLENYKN
jgi:hypothetical protein